MGCRVQSSYLTLNGAGRVIVAISAPLKNLSKCLAGVLSTDVQAMEESVKITRMGEEDVTAIPIKVLMVDMVYGGRTVARKPCTCRGGTREQTIVHKPGLRTDDNKLLRFQLVLSEWVLEPKQPGDEFYVVVDRC